MTVNDDDIAVVLNASEVSRRVLNALQREIEVLTVERDNALLGSEQLANDLQKTTDLLEEAMQRIQELEEMPDSEVGRAILADWSDARGGVHPNA